ncbi:MAG: aspartate aminotransferase family protein, partial [Candidatus Heimdallarchaeota archaeon]|nr:aspartate aminotransferase family protein [Candidatus Heimdallarchaeota archaeon]
MDETKNTDENCIFNMFTTQKERVFDHGDGIYIYSEGERYIDASSGSISNSLGYNVKEMGLALKEQADKMAFLSRMCGVSPILAEASNLVCGLTNGAMIKAFFVSGGSEAVEVAIKLARMYHFYKNQVTRHHIIGRCKSYHGNTMMTLSIGGHVLRRAAFEPYMHRSSKIPPAYCYRCQYEKTPETCNIDCAQALDDEILHLGPSTVSAFIAEPISGTALCAVVPHKKYFKRIREICDKYDVLLIFDEVMTGVGRTGKWFAYEHFGVVPDILVLG